MKKLAVLAAVMLAAQVGSATVYNDATGENIFNGHLDIVSVEVINDLTDVFFTLNLAGPLPDSADPELTWGNYMVGIDSDVGGSNSNAWSRPIAFNANPIETWVGTWTGFGGGNEVYDYDGANWNSVGAAGNYSFAPSNSVISFSVSLTQLGIGVGDTFSFDVFSAGTNPGDGAIDSLTDPNQTIADWGDAYETSGMQSYTVVPEPASLALLALGGASIAMFRRRRA